jgi:hypothetical protein
MNCYQVVFIINGVALGPKKPRSILPSVSSWTAQTLILLFVPVLVTGGLLRH